MLYIAIGEVDGVDDRMEVRARYIRVEEVDI